MPVSGYDGWSPDPLGGPALPQPDRLTPYLLRRIARTSGTQRRAHLRELGFRMLRRVTPSVAVDDRGMRIYVNTADLEMSRLVYIFGLYDEDLLTRVLDVLAALGRPDAIQDRAFLDVGANIGTTTLAAIRTGARAVTAIEPAPSNLALLGLNVAANGLGSRVHVVGAAASDVDGTVPLELSPVNSGDHRVRVDSGRGPNEFGESERNVVDVRAVTLDSLSEANEFDIGEVGLAWMDVQGHEARVLAGASRLCERDIPVVLEYWPYGLRAAGDADRLHRALADTYGRFVDMRRPFRPDGAVAARRIDEVAALAELYTAPDAFTDLLVLRDPA